MLVLALQHYTIEASSEDSAQNTVTFTVNEAPTAIAIGIYKNIPVPVPSTVTYNTVTYAITVLPIKNAAGKTTNKAGNVSTTAAVDNSNTTTTTSKMPDNATKTPDNTTKTTTTTTAKYEQFPYENYNQYFNNSQTCSKGSENDTIKTCARIYAGYEFSKVNTMFDKAQPRIGLLFFNWFRPANSGKSDSNFGYYGFQFPVNVMLTSSDEVAISSTADSTAKTVNSGTNKRFELEIPVFAPLLAVGTDNMSKVYTNTTSHFDLLGPEFIYRANYVDPQNSDVARYNNAYYLGLRLSRNPETYVQLLVGKDESLTSKRMELSGQLPLVRISNTFYLYGGVKANYGVFNRQSNEADSLKVYFSVNLDPFAAIGSMFGFTSDNQTK